MVPGTWSNTLPNRSLQCRLESRNRLEADHWRGAESDRRLLGSTRQQHQEMVSSVQRANLKRSLCTPAFMLVGVHLFLKHHPLGPVLMVDNIA